MKENGTTTLLPVAYDERRKIMRVVMDGEGVYHYSDGNVFKNILFV